MKSVKGYGPPCPYCGHISSERIINGWSEPHDDYLRYKKCVGCGEKFTTVEVVVPVGATTFYNLDYLTRATRREMWRRKRAKTKNFPGGWKSSDKLYVSVRVVPATPTPREACRRGHKWTEENTYITPSTNSRRCRLCRDINRRSYYIKNRDYLVTQMAERRKARMAERAA